jgi:hypothetical protein
MPFHVPEQYRITTGRLRTCQQDGNNGAFLILQKRRGGKSTGLLMIASDGGGWEHVSVSLPHRSPNWSEMSAVKALFWDPEDVVMQLHPAASEYINMHPNCLHLWRPISAEIPTPPSWMVGFRT